MKQYEGYWQQIREQLDAQGFVLLPEIFTEENVYEERKHVQQPDKHSYTETNTPQEIQELLTEIANKLELDTGTITTRTFQQGDFTLQDSSEPYVGVEIVYMHAPKWQPSFRGEITYTPINKDPLIVPVMHEAIAIIQREEEMRSFVKRVTHYANKNKLRITTARCEKK